MEHTKKQTDKALRPLKGDSVAIVGFSETTRSEAPWGDEEGWSELWICNRLGLQEGVTRWTRHFDPHTVSWSEEHFEPALWEEYRDQFLKLDHGDKLVYLPEASQEFPNSVSYPYEEVIRFVGRRYLTSAISYQIALALLLGAKRIGLWGIDLRADEEYAAQRPCAEWLLGLAQGMYVEIVVPDESAILNADHSQPLYGVEEGSGDLIEAERAFTARVRELEQSLAEMKEQNDALVNQMHTMNGALQETNHWVQRIRHKRRGGVF